MRFVVGDIEYDLPDNTKQFQVKHSVVGEHEVAIEFHDPEDFKNRPVGFTSDLA